MTTIVTETHDASGNPRAPAISWGAVFAGLVVTIAISWLLALLGSAIGVSVIDATDSEAIGAGFGVGAAIWVILTFVAAYFIGGIVSGRLSGHPDDNVGMLHGVTLWGVATLFSAWLAATGAASVLQGGYSVARDVASAGVSAGAAVGGAAGDFTNTAAFDRIQATVKRQARGALATGMAEQSDDITEGEAQAALQDIDQAVLEDVGKALLDGDTEGARSTLAAQTSLSQNEIDSLVNSAGAAIKSEIPGASTDENAAQAATDYLSRQLSQSVASVDQAGGEDVSAGEINAAISELDADVLQRVGLALVQGEPDRAKDILSSSTSLTDDEIEAVVSGAEAEVNEQVEQIKADVAATAEAASTYTTATLWALFAAGALALVASILGGRMGSTTAHRLYYIRES